MVHRIFYTLHGLVLLATLIWGVPGLLLFVTLPAHLIYGAVTYRRRNAVPVAGTLMNCPACKQLIPRGVANCPYCTWTRAPDASGR